jgi:glycosyltransferase involved in cell wall biosynthesis
MPARRQVHQLMAALSYGDAVSNHALWIRDALRRAGFDSEIFVEHVHPRMTSHVRPLWQYPRVSSPDTVCLFHFSIGSAAGPLIHALPDKVVTVYHNITPPEWFIGFRPHLVGLTYHGRRELACYVRRTSLALGVSDFNRRELAAVGFAPTGVLPIVPDWSLYERPGSRLTRELYADDRTNIVFVGRISPNKRIDDVIRAFAVYQRYTNPRSRLFLVGDHRGYEKYYDRLVEMVQALRLEEVVFTGHVDDDDLVAYYRLGHLFLCLSEHEGFCVPVLEAMAVGLPIVAYDAGAVAETLRGAGVLLKDKSPELVAELMGEILTRPGLRASILEGQMRVLRELKAVDFDALLLERLAPVLG